MQYTQGSLGRIFVMRFEPGELLNETIQKFVVTKRIKTGLMVFLGALERGDLVSGPKKAVVPPVPNWVHFRDGWEVMGIASIFSGSQGSSIHIHSSLGKNEKVLTGCIRKNAKVFIVLEAVLFELRGVSARKELNPETGLTLLEILRSKT